MVRNADCFRCCRSTTLSTVPVAIGEGPPTTGLDTVPVENRDLITLTKTRVPSLLIGTASERLTKAKIWVRPEDFDVVDAVGVDDGGSTKESVFSTNRGIRNMAESDENSLPLILHNSLTILIALTWTTSAMASAFSSHTPQSEIHCTTPAFAMVV